MNYYLKDSHDTALNLEPHMMELWPYKNDVSSFTVLPGNKCRSEVPTCKMPGLPTIVGARRLNVLEGFQRERGPCRKHDEMMGITLQWWALERWVANIYPTKLLVVVVESKDVILYDSIVTACDCILHLKCLHMHECIIVYSILYYNHTDSSNMFQLIACIYIYIYMRTWFTWSKNA